VSVRMHACRVLAHLEVGRGGGLVKSDGDGLGVHLAEVDLVLDGGLADSRGIANFDLCSVAREIQKSTVALL
jgi:hypothetical protein